MRREMGFPVSPRFSAPRELPKHASVRAFVVLGSIGKRVLARVGAERGFTLVETVIAISLMAIVATSLVGLLGSAYTAQKLSRQKTIAQQTAQDEIERVRRMSYDAVGVPNGNPTGTLTNHTVTKTGFNGSVNFTVQYVWTRRRPAM